MPPRATGGSASLAEVHLLEISAEELGAEVAPGFRGRAAFLLFYGNDTDGTRAVPGTRVGDPCREHDQADWLRTIRDEFPGRDDHERVVSGDPCRRIVVNTVLIADLLRQFADAVDERPANSNAKARKRRRPAIKKARPPGESDARARAEARRILRERGFVGGNTDD